MRCRIIEHTADTGIEVEADSLEELFRGAADGMLSLIVSPGSVSPLTVRSITLEAGDLEELMFLWLNEILFIVDSEGLMLSNTLVERVEELRLEGSVAGERFNPAKHSVESEIKAATYHQLEVGRSGGGWVARIIFDV